jgi:hypothetical protein
MPWAPFDGGSSAHAKLANVIKGMQNAQIKANTPGIAISPFCKQEFSHVHQCGHKKCPTMEEMR